MKFFSIPSALKRTALSISDSPTNRYFYTDLWLCYLNVRIGQLHKNISVLLVGILIIFDFIQNWTVKVIKTYWLMCGKHLIIVQT